ncbi:MAG: aminoglycoside phosphotransferase family protein [Ginsengibacter sp.]
MLTKILSSYGISPAAIIQPHGSGLINNTWKVMDLSGNYIFQKINNDVFKEPWNIADNIETISCHLNKEQPGYFFVTPIKTIEGKTIVYKENEGYFRLFPFVKNSHTVNVAETPQQAYEAARQFGLFTKMLKSLPVETLKITLPDFHNLSMRYSQFLRACAEGNPSRIKEAQSEIQFLQTHRHIVSTFNEIKNSPDFKLRVTHHDTKISNVLFDEKNKGICVIDLDTVMPGYFISDVGDMLRTYLSPASEEEKDFTKIIIRDEYFEAILQGYLYEMADELTAKETRYFVYSGMFMIYMQALRFLADYLNDDIYYGAAYNGQNYVRAQNQLSLLRRLMDKENFLYEMVIAAAKKAIL